MTAPHTPFRVVPTLTEIVLPHDLAPADHSDPVQLTERLLQRILPSVEAQLRASLQTLVQDHLRLLEPRLQQAIESASRQAIATALTEELNPRH